MDTPQGKVAVQIPINMVERHQSANDKVNYNWLYLAAAAGLVFWYVTRNKNRREKAMPAGYAGISGKSNTLSDVIVYDNGGETYDRYTVFTPDGSVYGMSSGAGDVMGFNLYVGDDTEIKKGRHLGKRLKSVPDSIKKAVIERLSE